MAIVYKHTTLDTNEVFYIGVGTNISRAYQKAKRNRYWNNVVKKHGYKVDIIYKDISYELALQKERELVLLYGRRNINTGCLVNLTDGGLGSVGYKPSEEALSKISSTSKGRKWSEDQKIRWISKMTFIVSEETKQKISKKLYGVKHTEERKKNISLSLKGRKISEESRNKLKQFYAKNPSKWKGRKLSEEHRKKLSISHTGKFGILSSNKKAVIKMTGEEKIEYFSISEAAKQNNVCSVTITKYINGKTKPKDNSSWYFKKSFEQDNLSVINRF